jgi:hypothetical protein
MLLSVKPSLIFIILSVSLFSSPSLKARIILFGSIVFPKKIKFSISLLLNSLTEFFASPIINAPSLTQIISISDTGFSDPSLS